MTRQINRQIVTRKRERNIDQDVMKAILDLVRDPAEYGASEIRRRLQARQNVRGELVFEDLVPELRTMQRVVLDIRGRLTPLDTPFQWHRLEKYGLPWEASGFLLKMWAFVQEFQAMLQRDYDWGTFHPVTVRLAQWWWRVHQAVPDVASLLDIHFWAGEFTRYELYKDLLGQTPDVSGLEAYLAYRPWAGPEQFSGYQRALNEGRIPGLPISWMEGGLREQLRSQKSLNVDLLPTEGADSFNPDVLPSVQLMEYLAAEKERVEMRREISRAGINVTRVVVVLDHGSGQKTEEVREI